MRVLRQTTVRLGVLALVGGLAFGGVAAATVAAKPMSERQWRKTANSICRQGSQLQSDLADAAFAGVPADGQPSLEQMTSFVTQLAPIVQQRIDGIDALKEPVKLKKKVAKLVKIAQEELDALVADPSRGLEGNPFSGASLASTKLGLKDCA